ncbi:MAG TPA: choice-of-anchor I family protein, partial [Acidobacteriota bacterium]|nr:choice-of-anchor I family protein [Acidobacteriota bacterium]
HDPVSQRLFVVNSDAAAPSIYVLNISDPTNPTLVTQLTFSSGPVIGDPNSVAVRNGILAVALAATPKTNNGTVAFYNTSTLNFLTSVTAGALPDMVTFTPDATKVLVANEGEPDTVNPPGSVTIIPVSYPSGPGSLSVGSVTTATFTAFNGQEATLRTQGVRIQSGVAAADDFEPEYIAVSSDSTTAWVTLQENNTVAVVNLGTSTVTSLLPLGLKDHNLTGNGLDASDRDLTSSTGKINIQNWPVFGMYMPDSIATMNFNGQTYFLTANEGDARDGEEVRVGSSSYVLDPAVFPNASTLKMNANLGRLTVSNRDGQFEADGDTQYEKIYVYGSRSFSVWTATGTQVFDSGDDFEQITAALFPANFNSNNDANNSFDTRSDNKGPEPEGLTLGVINGRTYAFIGLERISGIMVYDVTNPLSPVFIQYLSTRNFAGDPVADTAGDLGPEGITFISSADSPTGTALLAVGNEISGSTTIFEIRTTEQSVIYVADTLNNRIQTFDGTQWNVVSGTAALREASEGAGERAAAGSGAGQFRSPEAVTSNNAGGNNLRVYVADTGNNRIHWFDGTQWQDFATFGSGFNQVRAPQGVTLDATGKFLFVADTSNNRILRFDALSPFSNATVIATAGTGAGQVRAPQGLAIDLNNTLYVADTGNNRVVKFANATTTPVFSVVAISGTTLNRVRGPQGLAVDNELNLYIADTANSRVLFFPLGTTAGAQAISTVGSGPGQVRLPEGITVVTGPEGKRLVISDTGNNRIQSTSLVSTAPFTPGDWRLVAGPGSQTGAIGSLIGQFRTPGKIR